MLTIKVVRMSTTQCSTINIFVVRLRLISRSWVNIGHIPHRAQEDSILSSFVIPVSIPCKSKNSFISPVTGVRILDLPILLFFISFSITDDNDSVSDLQVVLVTVSFGFSVYSVSEVFKDEWFTIVHYHCHRGVLQMKLKLQGIVGWYVDKCKLTVEADVSINDLRAINISYLISFLSFVYKIWIGAKHL